MLPAAAEATTQQLLTSLVENLIAVDDLEARRGLACNAHSTNGRNVIMPAGNPQTSRELETMGYDVVEIDTSEFIKAGGSVYCMKMMYW